VLFRNHCYRGKAISIACSECVSVALVIQYARRMRHRPIMLPSVACPVLLYIFPRYLINGTNFGGKVIEYKMCVLIFSTSLSAIFLSLKRTELDIVTKVPTVGLRVKYALFLSDFNET